MTCANKVIVLGLDGAVPRMFLEATQSGRLRNFMRLMERGVFSYALPLPSNVTPGNWASVTTGAYPGTHGISDFVVHVPGDTFSSWSKGTKNAFYSTICQAEFIWDSLSQIGIKTATISFPGSLPRRSENHIAVGDHGRPSENSVFYMVSPARCFATL